MKYLNSLQCGLQEVKYFVPPKLQVLCDRLYEHLEVSASASRQTTPLTPPLRRIQE